MVTRLSAVAMAKHLSLFKQYRALLFLLPSKIHGFPRLFLTTWAKIQPEPVCLHQALLWLLYMADLKCVKGATKNARQRNTNHARTNATLLSKGL